MLGLILHKRSMLLSLRVGLLFGFFSNGTFAALPTQDGLFPQYQFIQVIPVIFGLLFIVFILYGLDKQLKKRVEHKFWSVEHAGQPITTQADSLLYIKWLIVGTTLFGLLLAVYFYSSPIQQQYLSLIKYTGIGLLMLSAYFLGTFIRGKQVEFLISNLDQRIERKKTALSKLVQGEQRLANQQEALSALAKNQLKDWQNPLEVFKQLSKISAETLNVDRVSVWMFDKAHQQLNCLCLYSKSQNLHSSGALLEAKDLPKYFNELATHRVIAVSDAMTDPFTAEFTRGYLQQNNIGAMLDGTISLNGETIGVVCHEHVGGQRDWALDEQSFVGSLADLARLTIETDRRRKAEQALIKQNEELEQIVQARTSLLQKSQKTFEYVVKNAPIPILILNSKGDIVDANPAAQSASGYDASIAGKNFIELIVSEESRKKAIVTAANAMKGRDFKNVELVLQNAAGEKIEYACSLGAVVENVENGQNQVVAIAHDVSAQKALQNSLIKARESAESADRIKSMFVASMSHELRTPLNSIIGFLGVVLQGMSGELNLKQKDQLGRAYHSSKHLLSLITDVIDISKIEAGFLQVYVEKFELATLLTEVQHAVQHLAEDKGLVLMIDCPPQIKLETDRKRLYQVVLNVVSNALKYSEQGTVKVATSIKDKQLIVSVEDTGIGIGEADLANLFKPFVRIDSHLKIKTLGTGLGLYLTRKILVQLLGGEVSVTSQLGVGSVFTIRVPIKMPKVVMQNQTSILEDSLP